VAGRGLITVCVPKATRRVVFGTQTVTLIREPAGMSPESAIDGVMTHDNTSTSQTVVLVQRRLEFIGDCRGREEYGVVRSRRRAWLCCC